MAIRTLPIAVVAYFLCACGSNGVFVTPSASMLRDAAPRLAAAKIAHVVIIVQENRSLNDLFYGFPGARTVSYGYDSKGKKIALQPVGLDTGWDIDHSSYSFFAACNGNGKLPGTECRMNGFDKENWYCGHQSEPRCPNADPPYGYVPHAQTKPYFFLAHNYVLGDEMFASNFDGSSFISHQYIIAGQANSAVNYPLYDWGCSGGEGDYIPTLTPQRQFGPREVACWEYATLGDELDAAHLTWKFYTSKIFGDGGFWSAYQAVKHIYFGPDWKKDVVTPQTRFFDDVAKGRLPSVSWITPTCGNSDHAGCHSKTGPSWVASLVNAVGKSSYWNDTAIFVFWDDYGGWYDPAPPKMVDYDGLGVRVPLLIVSPYAKQGHVSHVHYEHGSILRFVEDVFGLARLAVSDRRAASPEADAFDFDKPPRKFVPIPSDLDANYFTRQPLDERIPDNQ